MRSWSGKGDMCDGDEILGPNGWFPKVTELGIQVGVIRSLNSQDLVSNSPYCLQYSSCDISFENLVLDQQLIL